MVDDDAEQQEQEVNDSDTGSDVIVVRKPKRLKGDRAATSN